MAKSNLAKFPSPLAYRLAGVDLADGITTSKVEWLGEAPEVDVRELLAIPDRKERKGDRARSFLVDAGVETVARPAAELEDEAADLGINYRTLRRAREDIGIPAWRAGFGGAGAWWWGPKRGDDIGDNAKRTPNRSSVSPLTLPAETDPQEPIGDNVGVAGETLPSTDEEAVAYVRTIFPEAQPMGEEKTYHGYTETQLREFLGLDQR